LKGFLLYFSKKLKKIEILFQCKIKDRLNTPKQVLKNLSKPNFIISNMSRTMNKKQMSAVKPYCKVCHDAGKSEKEYTSHYVKSAPGPEGKVVCPTLLSQSCGYCGACGHTPKFCPTLAAEKVAEEKALKQAARRETLEKREAEKAAPKPAAPAKKPSNNVFAALDSDDEEPKVSRPQSIEPKPVAAKVVAPVAAKKPVTATKLFANVNEFPSLSGATSSGATSSGATSSGATKSAAPKVAAKSVAAQGKPQFLSAINQLCPQLNVATKMPEVNIAKPTLAKLVRKDDFINDYISNKLGSDAAYQQHDSKLTAELAQMEDGYDSEEDAYAQAMHCNGNGYDVTAYYEEALKAYQQTPYMKASQMNWAMTEADSDEDW